MVVVPRWLAGLPLPLRSAVIGALTFGVLGSIAGLVIGLIAYPPTAWFAIFEVGAPAIVVGYVLGFLGGSVPFLFRLAMKRGS